MRTTRLISTIETHTQGTNTRVVTGGIGIIPGETMNAKRLNFMAKYDHLRTFLMTEPRGHSTMSGAILQPSTRPDADWGVIFIEVSGCLPMCGHGSIGVTTALIETGMVPVNEPVTIVRLDTPAGVVVATATVEQGHVTGVTLASVPSYSVRLDQLLDVDGWGTVSYSLAFGGNFYAIVDLDALNIDFDRKNERRMISAGMAIMDAINAHDPPSHPTVADVDGCHHVYLTAPGSGAQHSRHAMCIRPGWIARDPCGTGTAARMAELYTRGLLALNTDFINESILGSHFIGRLEAETSVSELPAVLPTITGQAWISGTAQFMLDPTDPFPDGFSF